MILLETIAKSGFSITTDGKNLLLKPSGLPSDLREQVRESKAEITRELILDIADSIILEACRIADLAGGNSPIWEKSSNLVDLGMVFEELGDRESLARVVASLKEGISQNRVKIYAKGLFHASKTRLILVTPVSTNQRLMRRGFAVGEVGI